MNPNEVGDLTSDINLDMNPNEVDEWCVNLINTLQQIEHENNLISPSITNVPITSSISNNLLVLQYQIFLQLETLRLQILH